MKTGRILCVFVLSLSFLTGCGKSGPNTQAVDKQFRMKFLSAFGCPVRECSVVKLSSDTFSIDYAYRQCPICHTDINYADHPCVGHSPQPRRSRATARVDSRGRLRFFLASGSEFDSWGTR